MIAPPMIMREAMLLRLDQSWSAILVPCSKCQDYLSMRRNTYGTFNLFWQTAFLSSEDGETKIGFSFKARGSYHTVAKVSL